MLKIDADRFAAGLSQIPLCYPGRRSAASWNLAYHTLARAARASRSATSFGPVCDQDNVMEFGLNAS